MAFLRAGRRPLLLAASLAALATPQQKPSIYSPPLPPPVLQEAPPSFLEENISLARTHVEHAYSLTHTHLRAAISNWITVEEAVERRIKSFKSPSEDITPPILYVLTSTLLGSIIARRSLFLRFSFPPVFLVASSYYFLPKTSANIGNYIYSLEEEYAPGLAKAQIEIDRSIGNGVQTAKKFWSLSTSSIHSGLEKGINWTQDASGLKLREAWGLSSKESNQSKSL